MKDCPYKWREKSFKENDSFSIKKIVGSTLELSAKCFSHWTSTYLKIWVENPVFAIQHIENRKSFTEVLPPPPPPRDQNDHFAYCCSFTFYRSYKNCMIGHGGRTMSKCSKTI